jgi:hypothetical protein
MNEVIDQPVVTTPSDTDLVAAIRVVLEASSEPLTLSKIRAQLPSNLRGMSLDALGEALRRQVAANVLVQYPKYRSQQDRFWDRPMRVHIAQMLRTCLGEQPLALSELRRKLPDYAKPQAQAVLDEELARGNLHRHPPANSRSGERFSAEPADPKTFLRTELTTLFGRLGQLGFTQAQLRQAAIELLHEEEWAPTSSQPLASPAVATGSHAAPPHASPELTGTQQAPPPGPASPTV